MRQNTAKISYTNFRMTSLLRKTSFAQAHYKRPYDFRTATRRRRPKQTPSNQMIVKIVRRILSIVYYLEVEDMCFIVGKSSAKPSLKLHLLWLGMQPLYQDVKICDLAL